MLQQPRVLGQQVFGRLLGFLQQFDVVGKVGHFELGQAMLPVAKEVARATQLQILFCNAEAIAALGHHLKPAAGLFVLAVRHQHTVGLQRAAAHPAPELVELGKAEAVGVFHDHQGSPGHVDPHFDHRGADQHIQFPLGKRGHDPVFFPGF